MKATLREVGRVATTVGWCRGIRWQTTQARARRPGWRGPIGSAATVLFNRYHPAAALHTLLALRQLGFAAGWAGPQWLPTADGGRAGGWAVVVAVVQPVGAAAGWADAPRYAEQGALARREARREAWREREEETRRDGDGVDYAAVRAAGEARDLEQALAETSVAYRDLGVERQAYRAARAAWRPGRRWPTPPRPDERPLGPGRSAAEEAALEAHRRASRPALYDGLWAERLHGPQALVRVERDLPAGWLADAAEVAAELGPWDGETDEAALVAGDEEEDEA